MRKDILYSVLIGLGIVAGFVILSYYVYVVEASQIEQDRKRITDLVMEAVSSQSKNLDVYADMIGAFYDGSEIITEEEFELFVSHMLSDVSLVRNVAVMQDNTLIQSYPIKDHTAIASKIDSQVTTIDGMQTILVRHEEPSSDITVFLLIDPHEIIPTSKILQKPYRLELTLNDESLFYLDTESERTYFSDTEMKNLLVVQERVDFLGHENPVPQILTYSIWEDSFMINYNPVIATIISGLFLAGMVSFLEYRNHKQKEEIQSANQMLSKNQEILKKTQSLLLESDERYRNIFELSPLGISIIDLEGKITSCNSQAADTFGYTKNEAIGMHFTEFVAQKDRQKSNELFKMVLSEGMISKKQILCKRKDGTEFSAVINAGVMKDKNAQNSGIICIVSKQHKVL